MQAFMYDSITYKVPFIKILRTGWSVNDAVKDFLASYKQFSTVYACER